MATHSSILAWKIPWTEETSGLQSLGSQRVGHDWATNTTITGMLWPQVVRFLLGFVPNVFFLKHFQFFLYSEDTVVAVQSLSHGWLCDPKDCSTPGFLVLHYLSEFAQTHVHWAGDVIQPSHCLSMPSSPALNLPQHQGLFWWAHYSYQVAKVLELQLQHQSFLWIFRIDFFGGWQKILMVPSF